MTANDEPTGVNLLIQRFIDRDLSPDESIALLSRVARDGDLRDRLVALEEIARDAARLPKAAVPATFVSDVAARIAETTASAADVRANVTTPSRWRQLWRAAFAPRHLRWNVASALAAAVVVMAVGVGVDWSRPPVAGSQPTAIREPADGRPVLVRFVVVRPEAQTVHVAGDFNGWAPAATPLEPLANGAWAVTLPLEPGRYEYMFVVDDNEWVVDPYALERRDDGFGAENAVIEIRPPREDAS